MPYTVFVDDNFHYMDESERVNHGAFESYDEAVAACKSIVDQYLCDSYKKGIHAKELFSSYTSFGDDPFISPANSNNKFSSWKYAEQRCYEICNLN